MGRIGVGLVLVVLVLGGCRVKEQRIGGRKQVEVVPESVRISTESTKVQVGSESMQVRLPKVHVGGDSGR